MLRVETEALASLQNDGALLGVETEALASLRRIQPFARRTLENVICICAFCFDAVSVSQTLISSNGRMIPCMMISEEFRRKWSGLNPDILCGYFPERSREYHENASVSIAHVPARFKPRTSGK
jgi:hypothetical protein